MRNPVFTFLLCLCALSNINGQEAASSKFYSSLGYFISSGFFPGYEIGSDSTNTEWEQGGVLDFGYSYGLKYNVLDLNDNMSISLNAKPSLGIGFTPVGFISLRLPVSAAFNFGAGSTYDTDSDYGLGLEGGIEYLYAPIFRTEDNEEIKNISNYSPFAQISFRYWKTSKNRLHELFFRWNFIGPHDETLLLKYPNVEDVKPFMFSVGFNRYLDY